jgi:hypothetical protein
MTLPGSHGVRTRAAIAVTPGCLRGGSVYQADSPLIPARRGCMLRGNHKRGPAGACNTDGAVAPEGVAPARQAKLPGRFAFLAKIFALSVQ